MPFDHIIFVSEGPATFWLSTTPHLQPYRTACGIDYLVMLNWVLIVKFSVLNYFEMDVVREIDYFQTKVTAIYEAYLGALEHNWGVIGKNLEHCSKA